MYSSFALFQIKSLKRVPGSILQVSRQRVPFLPAGKFKIMEKRGCAGTNMTKCLGNAHTLFQLFKISGQDV